MSDPPYGDVPLLADTSAWTHVRHLAGDDKTTWTEALRRGQIATCDVVVYELAQGEHNHAGVVVLETRFAALMRLQIRDTDWHRARSAIRELAAVAHGFHRGIRVPDALVAVVAERHGFGVLQYDHDFDRLADVVEFHNQRLSAQQAAFAVGYNPSRPSDPPNAQWATFAIGHLAIQIFIGDWEQPIIIDLPPAITPKFRLIHPSAGEVSLPFAAPVTRADLAALVIGFTT